MLLDLGIALWNDQVWHWQYTEKAWTSEEKIIGCIGWYLKGQHVGETPIFDGICSRCGDLLFGNLREGGSCKVSGAPCDITDEETTDTAQPPFLLRLSPSAFAEKLRDVFAWDAETNNLSLKAHHHDQPPWKSRMPPRQKSKKETWLYCDGFTRCCL